MSNLIGNIKKEGEDYWFYIIGRTIDNQHDNYKAEQPDIKMAYGSRSKIIEGITSLDFNDCDVFLWKKNLAEIVERGNPIKVQSVDLEKIETLFPVYPTNDSFRKRVSLPNGKNVCYFDRNKLDEDVNFPQHYYLYSERDGKIWGMFGQTKEVFENNIPQLKIKHHDFEKNKIYYTTKFESRLAPKVDCSSTEQLKRWFAEEFNLDLNSFKQRNNAEDEIYNVRWYRLKSLIETLELQSQDLIEIYNRTKNSGFGKRITEEIKPIIAEEYIQELKEKDETVKKFEEQKQNLEKDVHKLESEIVQLKQNKDQLSVDFENQREELLRNQKAECQNLAETKNRLENELANLKKTLTEKTKELDEKEIKYKTAAESIKQKYSDLFSDMKVLMTDFEKYDAKRQSIVFPPYEKKNDTTDLDEDYSDYGFASIIPSIAIPFAWANILPHCKIYTIHVEHDWLHYNDFINHGLLDVWEEAFSNSSIQYILILDSLNLARPECGLKPLLDLINKKTPKLLGSERDGLPNNLKIMATLLKDETEEGVGIKLDDDFFKEWDRYEFRDESSDCSQQENKKPRLKLVTTNDQ